MICHPPKNLWIIWLFNVSILSVPMKVIQVTRCVHNILMSTFLLLMFAIFMFLSWYKFLNLNLSICKNHRNDVHCMATSCSVTWCLNCICTIVKQSILLSCCNFIGKLYGMQLMRTADQMRRALFELFHLQ